MERVLMNQATEKELKALLAEASRIAERIREIGSSQPLREAGELYWGAAQLDKGVGIIQETFGWEE